MRAQLLHLSGPSRGRTVTYAVPLVTIGSAPTCTAYLPAAEVAADHARIEWVQEACSFHLHATGGQVFVNGHEIKEVILADDDEIEFGVDGPRARFRVYVPMGAVCKPVRRMFADARAVARVSGGGVATGALTRDLLTQATPRLKVLFPLAVVAVALGVLLAAFLAGWLGGKLGSRPSEEEKRRTADMVTHAELEQLRQQQEQQTGVLATLSQAGESVSRIQQEWSRGVCLVHGIFGLRLPDDSWFTLDGTEPFEREYTGSGFLVTEQGHIVTNRHVVVPWEEMEDLQPLLAQGARPEFRRLTVTFPGHRPVEVPPAGIRLRSDALDVAVVQVAAEAMAGVPVLPLEAPRAEAAVPADYQRAIVVGYPTGLAALLVRADNQLVEALRQRQASMTEAIDSLAAADQIKPVITQGLVSNVEERMLSYDAATTYGGSGGPVFGDHGVVIAVNFAIQQGFHGSNYGVPIRFVRELLPR
ncbi:MAG: trypsin-like peptidase domain-containing protein [Planctomycetes bacterium]|nr:trypsin-like peptidase domain-containing protein [Planctomycetota bacterium]